MNIKTTRSIKKRHNSAPHGDLIDETVESELAILPASLNFTQSKESLLLQSLISDINGSTLEFKLAPAYSLYMMARHHLSSDFHPEPNRHASLVQFLKSACSQIKKSVRESKSISGSLAFWLANSSELLHFLRRDYRLYMLAHEYENTLISIIHSSYRHFTEYMVREVGIFLSAFFSDSPNADDEENPYLYNDDSETSQEPDVVPISHTVLGRQASLSSLYWSSTGGKMSHRGRITIGGVLSTLTATVSLLHLCQVNQILSILIFNLLFRYISISLFNKLISDPKLCSKAIGQRLLRRLDRLKSWADKENLKMPAEEHLNIIFQAVRLTQVPKKNPDDVKKIHGICPSLNSEQIATLLHHCKVTEGEGCVHPVVKEQLIALAYKETDQFLISEGKAIHLKEDPTLELPFLIPEHGYSCDTMWGVPVGLEEYLEHSINAGYCQLVVAKDTLGGWVPPRVTTSNQREPLTCSTQTSNSQMSQTLPKGISHNPPFTGMYSRPHSASHTMPHPDRPHPHTIPERLTIISVTLTKGGAEKSLGISICEEKDPADPHNVGIFIRSLSSGGPAYKDGRLHPGDQIIRIDNSSLTGSNKDTVIKMLKNSSDKVKLTVAKHVAQTYGLSLTGSSPRASRRQQPPLLDPPEQEYAPPLKEGSSHAIKERRRRLQYNQGDILSPSRQDYMSLRDPYGGWGASHLPPHAPTPPHMARWIQEQRDLAYQQSSYLHNSARPSQSLSSLVPERDDQQLGDDPRKYPTYDRYLTTTPSDSSLSDRRSSQTPYTNFNVLKSVSKLHDPHHYGSSNALGDMHYTRRDSPQLDQLSSCSSYTNESYPFPSYKEATPNSLSCQPSDSQGTGSQAYPSLVVEKLSMEVGYHTQLSSTGLSVTSVLDQLKKKKGNGLHTSELQEFEVDDIELTKQRMKLLFYEQEKQKQEQLKQEQENRGGEPEEETKTSDPPKEKATNEKVDPEDNHDDLMVTLNMCRQELDSLKKLISEQRKMCKEIHFSKEREEQSLHNTETKYKAQNSHHFVSDEVQLKKDLKKKTSEWEQVLWQKRDQLHRIEAKELKAKAKLKAYEQHASELKKQIQSYEHDLRAKGSELLGPKGTEWARVMSTESLNTRSSWMSSENPDKDIISIGSETNIDLVGGARHSPSNSNASSPALHNWHHQAELYGGEGPVPMHNPEHGTKMMRGPYEQHDPSRGVHRNTSLDSVHSADLPHAYQRRKDGQQKYNDSPPSEADMYKAPLRGRWSHDQTIMSHDYKAGVSQDGSTSENLSLSSSTPDVIPSILAPLPRPPQQRHSSGGINPHVPVYRGYPKAESLDLEKYHSDMSRRSYSPGNMRSSYDYGVKPHDYNIKSHDYSLKSHDYGIKPHNYGEYDRSDMLPEKVPPSSRYMHDGLPPEREHPSSRTSRRHQRPSSSTPHSYRLKRPDPPPLGGEERLRYNRGQQLSSSMLALASGEHVQRQQTEL